MRRLALLRPFGSQMSSYTFLGFGLGLGERGTMSPFVVPVGTAFGICSDVGIIEGVNLGEVELGQISKAGKGWVG